MNEQRIHSHMQSQGRTAENHNMTKKMTGTVKVGLGNLFEKIIYTASNNSLG